MIDLAIDGDYDRGLPERRMRVRRRDAVTAGTNPDPPKSGVQFSGTIAAGSSRHEGQADVSTQQAPPREGRMASV
jgi:hypothetical protein